MKYLIFTGPFYDEIDYSILTPSCCLWSLGQRKLFFHSFCLTYSLTHLHQLQTCFHAFAPSINFKSCRPT